MKANVTITKRDGRPKPFQVRIIFPMTDGKRPPERVWSFKSRKQAEAKQAELRRDFEAGRTPEALEDFELAKAQCLVAGIGLSEAVARGIAELGATAETSKITDTVEQATERYVADLVTRNCRPHSVTGARANLKANNKKFANRRIASITKTEFKEYLLGKTITTQRSYLSQVSPVLNLYKLPNWVSEIEGEFPKEDQAKIKFFTLDEVKLVMRAALPHWRGQIALCVFAGLRPENLHLLTPANVIPGRQMIDISSTYSKDRKNHLLEGTMVVDGETFPGIPPVLWKWLEKYPYQPMRWSSLRGGLVKRLKPLGVQWGQDILRHTFATYYYALYGLSATAAMLTHGDTQLVKRHYAGVATRADALAFFSYQPENFADEKKGIHWPTKARFRLLIHEFSPEQIGKHLGCSGAAVRKHVKKLGLKSPNWRSMGVRRNRDDLRAIYTAADPVKINTEMTLADLGL